MFAFARKKYRIAQGENREARPGGFFRQEKDRREVSFPGKDLEATVQVAFSFYTGKRTNCLVRVGILLLTPKNPGRKPGEFHWYTKKTKFKNLITSDCSL